MHPLNGPVWSLFYEHIANLLYALGVRKLPNAALGVLVAVTSTGDGVGAWALDATGLRIGFTRMLFPFFAGLLLSRTASLRRIPNAFLWCSLLLLVLAWPHVAPTLPLRRGEPVVSLRLLSLGSPLPEGLGGRGWASTPELIPIKKLAQGKALRQLGILSARCFPFTKLLMPTLSFFTTSEADLFLAS